ncbi:TIGR01458 family HAD-type hydrolase [Mariprofundus erugo]|uniref:TIGR01458 family HAD-type hydrolase n=1 Tax=Mariprofundus erugo TaxID=2528639 RepID=UPI0010FD504A|nr:TIGR01458 family HAD-type hydrolase [Mariprofundus erugo]TLS74802.1 TIGR01458 family HAD-type hydrolase [Mariprofundus erugo]
MKSRKQPAIDAVLFDLDGVLYIDDKVIRGAAATIDWCRSRRIPIAAVTNTTTSPRRVIADKLERFGIAIAIDEIYTPAAIAARLIGQRTARLYIHDSLQEDFDGIRQVVDQPDFIVMGDVGGTGYSQAQLQQIFRLVMDGSRLLALHKNRFWQKKDGLHMDLGAYVSAIEYATAKQATLLGKPSQAFFHAICKAMQAKPAHTLMIGDDIESDIDGAGRAGLRTGMVQTGKYRESFFRHSGIKPDLLLPSVADLPDAIQLL